MLPPTPAKPRTPVEEAAGLVILTFRMASGDPGYAQLLADAADDNGILMRQILAAARANSPYPGVLQVWRAIKATQQATTLAWRQTRRLLEPARMVVPVRGEFFYDQLVFEAGDDVRMIEQILVSMRDHGAKYANGSYDLHLNRTLIRLGLASWHDVVQPTGVEQLNTVGPPLPGDHIPTPAAVEAAMVKMLQAGEGVRRVDAHMVDGELVVRITFNADEGDFNVEQLVDIERGLEQALHPRMRVRFEFEREPG
jgi:hypothetical protein